MVLASPSIEPYVHAVRAKLAISSALSPRMRVFDRNNFTQLAFQYQNCCSKSFMKSSFVLIRHENTLTVPSLSAEDVHKMPS
jgi:hypothetical protein